MLSSSLAVRRPAHEPDCELDSVFGLYLLLLQQILLIKPAYVVSKWAYPVS